VNKSELSGAEETYRVFGVVRDQFQRPLVGAQVEVFDRDIRRIQPLGAATTSEQGSYEVGYKRRDFAYQDKMAADVVVRVFDRDRKLLHETSTYFNAPAELRVDVDLASRAYAGPSEFERALTAIEPVTHGLALADLSENSEHSPRSGPPEAPRQPSIPRDSQARTPRMKSREPWLIFG
jgi:hypothetical protein